MGLEQPARALAGALAETEVAAAAASKLAEVARPFINSGASLTETAVRHTDSFLNSLPQASNFRPQVSALRAQQADLQSLPISDVRSLNIITNPNVFRGLMRRPNGSYDDVVVHTPEDGSREAIQALRERFRQEQAVQEQSLFMFGTVPPKVLRPVTIDGNVIPEAMVQPVVGQGMAYSIRRMSGMPRSHVESDIDKGHGLTSEYRKYSDQLNELTENPRIHRIVDAATTERLALSADFHFGNWRALLGRDDSLQRVVNIDNSIASGSIPRWVGDTSDYYFGWSSLPIAKPNLATLGHFHSIADTRAGHTWLRGIGMTKDEAMDTLGKVSWLRRGKYPDVTIEP